MRRFAVAVSLIALACSRSESPGVPSAKASPKPTAVGSAAPPAETPLDPLRPDHPPTLDTQRSPPAGAGDWVKAKPGFQSSRKPAERGGVEPCNTQDVDTSSFAPWTGLQQGHFTAPRENPVDETGHFDLIIHFHGDQPVLRELVASKQRFVLYTLSLDVGQNYGELVTSGGLYEAIVAGVEQGLSKRTGKPAKVGHLALSAWSAGFTGVAAVISKPGATADAAILIDGLHAARDPLSFEAQLKPFVDFGKRAAAGERFLFVTHSSIVPPGFASTTECAHYLEAELGGKPTAVRREDAAGLELIELFSKGNAHVRGYAGNDKADHCAQLFTLRDAFSALGTRWQNTH